MYEKTVYNVRSGKKEYNKFFVHLNNFRNLPKTMVSSSRTIAVLNRRVSFRDIKMNIKYRIHGFTHHLTGSLLKRTSRSLYFMTSIEFDRLILQRDEHTRSSLRENESEPHY